MMPGDIPVAQVHLDVREDIRRGHEPLARIMAAVKALADDEALVLRAPFEPIPLYDVLGRRGFAHRAERRAPDDWSVTFYRGAAALRLEPAPVPATRHAVAQCWMSGASSHRSRCCGCSGRSTASARLPSWRCITIAAPSSSIPSSTSVDSSTRPTSPSRDWCVS